MGRRSDTKKSDYIIAWIRKYLDQFGIQGTVTGVSGGVDSALTSTLCARTGRPALCVAIPIHQESGQLARAREHLVWLETRFPNVQTTELDMTDAFDRLAAILPVFARTPLVLANTRSRLRMTALYALANARHYLVAGTGNKIEDYGVGFFTKYGDGGVDFSPIGDLLKSQVRALARSLGIAPSIIAAVPTDGLWPDNRGDEDQIGATYDELEWALGFCRKREIRGLAALIQNRRLSPRQKEVLEIYLRRHRQNRHKLRMPPVCEFKKRGE